MKFFFFQLIFLALFFLVGFFYKKIILVRLLKQKDNSSFFDYLFAGILILIYIYVLITSLLTTTSVLLTFAPFSLLLYDVLNKVNFNSSNIFSVKLNYKALLPPLILFIVFFIFKYNFHFGDIVNTGYGDQGFYHSVALNLKNTGKETLNIYLPKELQKNGFIYHYWDLWMQGFFYRISDYLRLNNLFDINYFEINYLVYQPLLFFILLIGFYEIILRILSISNFSITYGYYILSALVACFALLHNFREFGIVHHPKQFIVALVTIFYIRHLLNGREIKYMLLFSPLLLFAYPLPGSVYILTTYLAYIMFGLNSFRYNYKEIGLITVGLLCVLALFIGYYFVYGEQCPNSLKIENSGQGFELFGSILKRIIIYEGYHFLKSTAGLIFLINILIWFNIDINNIFKKIIFLLLLFISVGHFISGIFYMFPEEFQFSNNDYTLIGLLLIFDIILLLRNLKNSFLILTILFAFIAPLSGYVQFNSLPIYYQAIQLEKMYYLRLKSLTEQNQVMSPATSMYQTTDILYSIINSSVKYNYDFCSHLPIVKMNNKVISRFDIPIKVMGKTEIFHLK